MTMLVVWEVCDLSKVAQVIENANHRAVYAKLPGHLEAFETFEAFLDLG